MTDSIDNSTRLTFRCKNEIAHLRNGHPMDGNIVMFMGKDTITVRCNNAACRHWTTIQLTLPGIDLDLRKAGITQSTSAPGGTKFNTEKPSIIIEQPEEVCHGR
jgi:hypothetical protein